MEKESILKDRTIVGSPLTHLFSLGILMFVFWLALSGDFAVKFVVYGLITSAVVAWICYPLLLAQCRRHQKIFCTGCFADCIFMLQSVASERAGAGEYRCCQSDGTAGAQDRPEGDQLRVQGR